jgi:glycosyltransferase involved in cell wall biosynthesis
VSVSQTSQTSTPAPAVVAAAAARAGPSPRPLAQPPELSVVIPAFNERESIGPLLAELRAALTLVRRSYEIVLVDDGSSDGTAERIHAEGTSDLCVVPVLLERNVGQSGALAAGFAHARGTIIITLDADLQNDPADLPRVLAAVSGGDNTLYLKTFRLHWCTGSTAPEAFSLSTSDDAPRRES